MDNPYPAGNRTTTGAWRYVPPACAALALLLMCVVDPVVAGAPLWDIDDGEAWVPLAMPWLPWLFCTVLAVATGFMARSRAAIALMSLLSLASVIVPAFTWSNLLGEFFPAAGNLWISMGLAAAAAVAFPALLLGMALRPAVRAAGARTTAQPRS